MVHIWFVYIVFDEKKFNSIEHKPFLEKYHISAYSYASSNPLRFKINAICMKYDIQNNYEKELNRIYPNLFRDEIGKCKN